MDDLAESLRNDRFCKYKDNTVTNKVYHVQQSLANEDPGHHFIMSLNLFCFLFFFVFFVLFQQN